MSKPLLRFIPLSVPTSAKAPPIGPAWTHQPKLDGYRCQVIKEGRRVALYSRNGNDWTEPPAGAG
jgi:ATP-dependent DNA ligase